MNAKELTCYQPIRDALQVLIAVADDGSSPHSAAARAALDEVQASLTPLDLIARARQKIREIMEYRGFDWMELDVSVDQWGVGHSPSSDGTFVQCWVFVDNA